MANNEHTWLEPTVGRRLVLGGASLITLAVLSKGAPLFAASGRSRRLQLNLLGQSLIRENICAQQWSAIEALRQRIRSADLTFSNLEVAIRGPRAGPPTRPLETLHLADPAVIDCLQWLGIGLVSTSNNHAFDVGTGGILDTMSALDARKMPFAGTGMSLAHASTATIVGTAAGPVGLVAAAAGFIREGGTATADRPGVAEIRKGKDGGIDADDAQRTLESIRLGRKQSDIVIAYLHDHLWEAENWMTADWKRAFARACIDAGASVFVSHGAPLLHGVEMYRGKPLFHGLGSFVFQTKKADDFYGPWAWQSLLAECRFDGGEFVGARLLPIQLNPTGVGGPADLATRGRPSIAGPEDAKAILDRLAFLSDRLGHALVRDGQEALLTP